MKGTEKQITWAAEIKNNFIKKLNQDINDIKARCEYDKSVLHVLKFRKEQNNAIINFLNNIEMASSIIDMRQLGLSGLFKLIFETTIKNKANNKEMLKIFKSQKEALDQNILSRADVTWLTYGIIK